MDLLADESTRLLLASLLGGLLSWLASRMKHKESMTSYVESGFKLLFEQALSRERVLQERLDLTEKKLLDCEKNRSSK